MAAHGRGRRRSRSSARPAGCPARPISTRFWRLLEGGTDAVSTLPQDRFAQAAFFHPRRGEPGRSYTFAAGHVGDAFGFDAGAFGISPREAAEMDPQQRLLLEVALGRARGCRAGAVRRRRARGRRLRRLLRHRLWRTRAWPIRAAATATS